MNCRTFQTRLDERLDGRLPMAAQQEFDAHLAACARCRGEWEAYAAAWRTLAQLEAREPSFGFVERTVRRLAEPEPAMIGARWSPPVFRWAMLATVAIAFGLAGWGGWRHYHGYRQAQIYAAVQQVDFLGDDLEVIASLDQLGGDDRL